MFSLFKRLFPFFYKQDDSDNLGANAVNEASAMEQLPNYPLIEIFKYLDGKDLLAVRAVCKEWRAVSNAIILRRKCILHCESQKLTNDHELIELFAQPDSVFPNIRFCDVELRRLNYRATWLNLGKHLEYLEIYPDKYSHVGHYLKDYDCYELWNEPNTRNLMTYKWFSLLNSAPKLKTLILAVGKVGDLAQFRVDSHAYPKCKLPNLQHLKIISSVGTDAILTFFEEATSSSKLVSFELVSLEKRFRDTHPQIPMDPHAISMLMGIIKNNVSTLQDLSLKNVPDDVIIKLTKMKDLKLKSFKGTFSERLTNKFFRTQMNYLREVDIAIYNNEMLNITCQLQHLRSLSVYMSYIFERNSNGFYEVKLDFLNSIPDLKKFVLLVDGLELSFDQKLILSTNVMKTHNLEVLHLNFLNMNNSRVKSDYSILEVVATTFPNLVELELSTLIDCVVLGVAEILQNVTNFRRRVYDCYEDLFGKRISQSEILDNITQMVNLEAIQLLNIYHIFDEEVFINHMRFKRLKKISIEGNDLISDAAMHKFFNNCPALEDIYLKSFPNVSHYAYFYGMGKLKNLKVLEIEMTGKRNIESADLPITIAHMFTKTIKVEPGKFQPIRKLLFTRNTRN